MKKRNKDAKTSEADRTRCESVDELEDQLLRLGQALSAHNAAALRHPDQQRCPEWSGADVRITSDFEWEPKDFIDGHDLLVRTRHAAALSWLFLQLRDAFSKWLDFSNKYGFYGALAQAALDQLASRQPEPDDPRPLLRAVLVSAFDWAHTLRKAGYIPQNAAMIIHTTDAEGRQGRIDPQTGLETV